jgi:hypothetical protein
MKSVHISKHLPKAPVRLYGGDFKEGMYQGGPDSEDANGTVGIFLNYKIPTLREELLLS